jgi:hypothetical protein
MDSIGKIKNPITNRLIKINGRRHKEILKQIGGSYHDVPDWYDEFQSHLEETYSIVGGITDNFMLTGGSAVAYLLYHGNFHDLLNDLHKPGDTDFLYVAKSSVENKTISSYTRKEAVSGSSVKYIHKNNELMYDNTDIVKSFDLTKVQSIKFITLNNIRVVSPNVLLRTYTEYIPDNGDSNYDKVLNKINILNKLIDITMNSLLIKNINNVETINLKHIQRIKQTPSKNDNNNDNDDNRDKYQMSTTRKLAF